MSDASACSATTNAAGCSSSGTIRSAAYPDQASLSELFEAQVARTPDATAVVAGDVRVSYAELDRRANAGALMLRDSAAGSIIAVACERSIEMVVGILATLKAGCAYLPLAPSDPHERIAYMLADSGAPVVLTQQRFATRFEQFGVRLQLLDGDDVQRDGDRAPRDNAGHGPMWSAPIRSDERCGVRRCTLRDRPESPKASSSRTARVARLVCNADYLQIGRPTSSLKRIVVRLRRGNVRNVGRAAQRRAARNRPA